MQYLVISVRLNAFFTLVQISQALSKLFDGFGSQHIAGLCFCCLSHHRRLLTCLCHSIWSSLSSFYSYWTVTAVYVGNLSFSLSYLSEGWLHLHPDDLFRMVHWLWFRLSFRSALLSGFRRPCSLCCTESCNAASTITTSKRIMPPCPIFQWDPVKTDSELTLLTSTDTSKFRVPRRLFQFRAALFCRRCSVGCLYHFQCAKSSVLRKLGPTLSCILR